MKASRAALDALVTMTGSASRELHGDRSVNYNTAARRFERM